MDDNNEVQQWRGSVSNKLDTIIVQTADHEKRLRSVEKKVWTASGIVGVIGALFGYLFKGGTFTGPH